MYGAFLYLNLKSAENLIRARLSRLRQPKYAIGLVFAALWFYTFFFRRLAGSGPALGTRGMPMVPAELLREMVIRIGAFVIVLRAVYAWALPDAKSGVIFSGPEIAFLFPAPISRRELIRYKLVASQTKILFTSLFLMLVSNRWGFLGGNWLTHAIGWWLFLSTMSLHGTAASLTISRLIDRGVSVGRRRAWVFGVVGGIFVLTLISAFRAAPAVPPQAAAHPSLFFAFFLGLLDSGLMHGVLFPFKLVTAPFGAADGPAFFKALGPALLVIALHFVWALNMETSFEEAAITASEKRAAWIAAARNGQHRFGSGERKLRRPAFPLRDTGRPELAFLWKNLLSAPAYFTPRVFLSTAIIVYAAVSWVGRSPEYSSILLLPLIIIPAIAAFYIFMVGPQLARQDMRSDLVNSDILKAYPIHGWQVILGEITTPVVILTALEWLMLIAAATAAWHYPPMGGFELAQWHHVLLAAAAGLAVVIPILCSMQMLVANSVVVLFPGWQGSGQSRQQGMEVMGQRIILSLGRLLVMVIALLPVVLCGGLMAGTSYWLGPVVGSVLAACTALAILAAEFWLALWWLGNRFERMDLSLERI